jgi:hypothetical protein
MVTDTAAVLRPLAVVPDTGAPDVGQVDGLDEEFFALIYSDEEFLRDEFDALIAAAWSSRPPPTPAGGRGAERPPDRPRPDLPPTLGCRRDGVLTLVRDSRARTRSPPDSTGLRHPRRRRRKEGTTDPKLAPLSPTGHEPGGWTCLVSVRSPSSARL